MGINSNKQLKKYFTEKLSTVAGSTSPKCIHFGECGGCSLQNLKYEDQLKLKLDAAKEIFSCDNYLDVELEIVGSPDVYEYRVKMDYVFAHEPFYEPNDRLGLRKKRKFRHVIDLQECHLIPHVWYKKVRSVYRYLHEIGLENYDLVSHKGFLRYLVIRVGGNSAMLNIVTKTMEYEESMRMAAEYALEQGFESINWVVHEGVADLSSGRVVKTFGEQFLVVEVGENYRFAIGAHSFFQNNIPAFSELMEYVRSKIRGGGHLLDLYSGVGTIGIMLADEFDQVTAVEISSDNHELASYNAEINDTANHEAILSDVGELITKDKIKTDCVVVDPPRVGLESSGIAQIKSIKPTQLVYISCNPVTQARDVSELLDEYSLDSIRLFDLYPQTLHTESVAVLSRRGCD